MRKFFCSLALLAVTFPIPSSDPNAAQHSDVAFLGVHHEAPSPDTIDQNHLDAYQGVEVTDVFSNSAAESMGIQEGDVILAINGVPIANGMDLRKEITSNLEGDPVSAVVRRKGEDIELNGEFGGMSGGAMRQDLNLESDAAYRALQDQRLQRQREALNDLRNQIKDLKNELESEENPKQSSKTPSGKDSSVHHLTMIQANGAWHLIYVIDSTVNAATEP